MPRGKKPQETNRRKNKKVEEEEEEEEEFMNEEEEVPKKSSNKKSSAKGKSVKKSSKRVEPDDEDDLSDLDVEEEDTPAIESADNDTVVSQKRERTPAKLIDPKTPIGELKTDEILSYLIQVGTQNLNPQLKYGALNLLRQLTGRRRPASRPAYGSKSNRNNSNRGGFNSYRGRNGNNDNAGSYKNKNRNHQDDNDDIYGNQE
jgi:hypothetical protein